MCATSQLDNHDNHDDYKEVKMMQYTVVAMMITMTGSMSSRPRTVKKSRKNLNFNEYLPMGKGESHSYVVDISMINYFYSTPTVYIHWNFKKMSNSAPAASLISRSGDLAVGKGVGRCHPSWAAYNN